MCSTNQDSQPCGNCKKETSFFCTNCLGAQGYENDSPAETGYCDAACQEADWESHNELCERRRARKILYRAGDTIKQVFQLFLKSKWCRDIYDVKMVRNAYFQRGDEPIDRCDTLYLLDSPDLFDGFLKPFPAELFLNEQEKESALAHLNCHSSIVCMQDMVESMLHGIYSKIEEVTVEPKNDRLKLMTINHEGEKDLNFYSHEIFRITMQNGEMYAMDLTSAQHGYYEPVTSWSTYQNSRVNLIEGILPFGETRVDELPTSDPARQRYNRFYRKARAYLNIALRDWQTENLAFGALLRLPDHEFEQQRIRLYAQIRAGLERIIPEICRRIENSA